jgi:hypothetical protein
MGIPWRTLLGILLVASGAVMWVYTPWWVWSAAVVTVGLGMFTFGSSISLAFLGAAGILFLYGYVAQPDAVSLIELLCPNCV